MIVVITCASASAEPLRLLDRDEYADRLRAMWLGEVIANWTGRRTEGHRTSPPFFTDDDWGTGNIQFVFDQDPWLADDDTDIEYVYLHLIDQHDNVVLTPEQIRDGWLAHMDPAWIWVSNAQAYDLMLSGVRPPASSLGTANPHWLKIDAQLTTEFFGAFAPGMPREALEAAHLPIATTARSHAAHASQAFMLMYSLAPVADRSAPIGERVRWVIDESRRYIPDSSKTADIIDFVTAHHDANPDPDDWESTRDAIYDRYQLNASANGFRYRGVVESSVNFATGIMCLLYGNGDYLRTLQIGTLSGWDSDNPTATAGGLLGLMLGTDALRAQIESSFPGIMLSERFRIDNTRINLPDHTPDPDAQDTFALMADRMIPHVEALIAGAGGYVDDESGVWLLPPREVDDLIGLSPAELEHRRSANLIHDDAGQSPMATGSVASSPPSGRGLSNISVIYSWRLQSNSGIDDPATYQNFYSSQGGGQTPGDTAWFAVQYAFGVEAHTVRFIEGDHFGDATSHGGYWNSVGIEVLIGGVWTPAPATMNEPLDESAAFQIIDFELDTPVVVEGVRLIGQPGGDDTFVTISHLDAIGAPAPPRVRRSFDLDASGRVDVEDLYRWYSMPVDLDGDGSAGGADADYLMHAVRWGEAADMTAGRR